MKNHNKYVKLPQDLDLSFHSDLDLLPDTAADIDVELDPAADTDVAALSVNVPASLGLDEDDDDEVIIAPGGGGLRLAPTAAEAVAAHRQHHQQHQQRKQLKNQLEQKQILPKSKICGLGSDSIVEVSYDQQQQWKEENDYIKLLLGIRDLGFGLLRRLQLVAGGDS